MSINILSFENDITAKSKTSYVRGMEWQDISQELFLHLWQKRDKFDPTKASERTFVVCVITNKIRDLVRQAGAEKRFAENNAISLERLIEEGFDVAEREKIYA